MVSQPSLNALVICTLDRPLELERCLFSCLRSSTIPDQIIVCDASRGDQAKAIVEYVAAQTQFNVSWIRGPIGLTKQRNFAVSLLASHHDVIHFVDDDVVVGEKYFEAIDEAFALHKDMVGCGGIVMNIDRLPDTKAGHRQKRMRGRVSRMGVNHIMRISGEEEFGPHQLLDVDWLSGCCMSFRANVFQTMQFDEGRPGSGIGEDVDFSLRVKAKGRLVINTAARVDHLQSPKSRPNRFNLGVQSATHRLRLSADGLIGGSPLQVASRCVWNGLANVAGGWRYCDSGKRRFGRGILVGVWRWYRRGGCDLQAAQPHSGTS